MNLEKFIWTSLIFASFIIHRTSATNPYTIKEITNVEGDELKRDDQTDEGVQSDEDECDTGFGIKRCMHAALEANQVYKGPVGPVKWYTFHVVKEKPVTVKAAKIPTTNKAIFISRHKENGDDKFTIYRFLGTRTSR